MRRWLIYLTIFCLFFGLNSFAVAYLIEPATSWLIWGWLVLVGAFVFCLSSLILSLIKTLRPDHKLPGLLVKSTVFHSSLMAVGVVGILVLRWWNGGLLQIMLWCIILLSGEWLVRVRRSTSPVDEQPKLYMNRNKRSIRKH